MGMDVQAASGGHGKKKGKSRPEMNVTPLVDVVLVLLIIFMVVMPSMQRFFWVHVPPDAQDEPPPNQQAPIVVTVTERGELRINQDVYPDATFPVRLRRMLVARADRKIYFDAADDAPFERAVEAMDLARGAGAAHIAVMTERLR